MPDEEEVVASESTTEEVEVAKVEETSTETTEEGGEGDLRHWKNEAEKFQRLTGKYEKQFEEVKTQFEHITNALKGRPDLVQALVQGIPVQPMVKKDDSEIPKEITDDPLKFVKGLKAESESAKQRLYQQEAILANMNKEYILARYNSAMDTFIQKHGYDSTNEKLVSFIKDAVWARCEKSPIHGDTALYEVFKSVADVVSKGNGSSTKVPPSTTKGSSPQKKTGGLKLGTPAESQATFTKLMKEAGLNTL